MNRFTTPGKWLLALLLSAFWGCQSEFLDINTDPNNPSAADLNLLMPSAQAGYVNGLLANSNNAAAAFVDMIHSGTWGRWLQTNSDFNEDWKGLYAQALKDLEVIIAEAERTERRGYAGMAKIQKAYVYSLLVDLWGDVPYAEALVAASPKFDDGQGVYASALSLLEEGMADLAGANGATGVVPANADVIYRGNYTRWLKMARTLKLKLHLQTRLVDAEASRTAIAALLQDPGSLIAGTGEDFQFGFGSTLNPQNTHRLYFQNYQAGKSGYMSNHFLHKLIAATSPALGPNVRYGAADPRLRYYIYRQVSVVTAAANIPCTFNNITTCQYGYQGNGYVGRDRGDNSVVPADLGVRSTYGVYPVGGLFDADTPKILVQGDGRGSGIFPMLTYFMVQFMQAEAVLTLGVPGNARQLLEAGMRTSITKVMDFGAANSPQPIPERLVPTAAAIDAYIRTVLAKYDAADQAGKLEIVMDQAYLALFGNGIEAYNNYRRTGYPTLMHPTETAVPEMPLRLIIASDESATNPNTPTGNVTILPVFWDK